MQITAELDAQHVQRIQQLHKILGKNIQTLLELAIDELYTRHQVASGTAAREIFQRQGFIGCLHEESNLSSQYKQVLDWSDKV